MRVLNAPYQKPATCAGGGDESQVVVGEEGSSSDGDDEGGEPVLDGLLPELFCRILADDEDCDEGL